MSKNLMIVESPSKGKTIAKYLGKDFHLMSSQGHVRDIEGIGKNSMGIDFSNGYAPNYVIEKDKIQLVESLRKEALKADKVWLASDPDREGEAIAWHIQEILQLPKEKVCRITFNDTTKELLYTVAEHAQTKAFSTFKISSYPANFLNAGQCIFAIDSTGGATWMGSDAPLIDIAADKLVQFETAVMPIPQFDPQNPVMISQGPSMCVFNKSDPQEVLASWLFAQFMLTDEVQIAYAQTEGYVPVTSKAQESPEYQDYLSRAGEDNQHYYDVKIKASKLLLDNTEHTFVTPVFNGSASLRNAAGQMIEEVTKAVRRKKDVNETFVEALFEDMTSLYRLNQRTGVGAGKKELGALPGTAVALIVVLISAWIGMGLYVGISHLKKKRKSKVSH